MAKKEEKPKMGGAREGAGRKPKDGIGTSHVGIKINKEHLELINRLVEAKRFASKSEFICKAVKEKLRREGLL